MAEQESSEDTTQSGGDGFTGESGFPANTPLEQMNHEQQAAYWKHQSRKHEDRVKQFGKLTPEELDTLRDEAGRFRALEYEMQSDMDKRVAEAAEYAAQDADSKWQPKLVETAFRIAIGDRKNADELGDFLADLNLSRFITEDGDVDTAKVLARVEQFAPATGSSGQKQQPRGPIVTPHAPAGQAPVKPGDGARAYLASRGIQTHV